MVNATTKDPIWTTKDGERMRVSQMARTHIMHCIQIMGVHGTWRSDLRPRLELELRVRDAIGRED